VHAFKPSFSFLFARHYCMALVRRLIRSGAVSPEDIGVITPYSAQVGVLRDLRAAVGLLRV
jgi:hypothetical protein